MTMATVKSRSVSASPAAPGRVRQPQKLLLKVLLTALAATVAILFILPGLWMLLGSLRPGNQVIESVSPLGWHTLFPTTWTLDNYVTLFGELRFGRSMANSLLVAFASVVLGLVISVPAAYAVSVLRFPGREAMFTILVVGFMIPFEAIAIPLAQFFTDWHLNNSYLGLILPGIGNGLAIFNLRQSFRGVPSSLREAAFIDGASDLRIMTRIYVPLNITTMINSALLIFLAQWSSYLWPLLMVSDERRQVAPIAIARTYTDTQVNFGQMFGGTLLISVVPALLLLFLQRFFARSIATSGEK
ncbi:MAG: multiple sugar transport system permease protein [Kribbellaceae bacterium]|jgi:ABC-type glycerol-3-phosphate transport system permease component|nr:multiple sugar transport system permease protein [Kribbellaceae bacterium]